MSIMLADLTTLIGGELVGGGPSLPIDGAATLETATPRDITLIDAPDKLHLLAKTVAAAAIVPAGSGPLDRPTIEVADVHAAFATVIAMFRPPRAAVRLGVSPQAAVDPSARLAGDVEIHPFATVGADCDLGPGVTIHAGARIMAGCRIGAGSTIDPNAVLYDNTVVGQRCVIHANAVLGAHGFGYKVADGRYVISAQLGWVELGDDVEVGAGTTIDRGTYGPTVIGTGTICKSGDRMVRNGPTQRAVISAAKASACRAGRVRISAGVIGIPLFAGWCSVTCD